MDFQVCAEGILTRVSGVQPGLTSFHGHRFVTCVAWLGALLAAGSLCGQSTNFIPRYEWRAEHDPDGTGKFYFGREIAQVMGHQGADWLERPERAQEEQTDLLVKQLKVRRGEVVADIGAGTGYISRRLAALVGPEGKVMAVDIQPEMLALLTNKMAGFGISNVVPVLGNLTNPMLARASVDLAVMVDVYHEFEFPYEMMSALCRALKPGGRVAFVEYRREDPNVPIKLVHKMTAAQVRKEMSVQPLEYVETSEVLPRQHVLIFRRTGR